MIVVIMAPAAHCQIDILHFLDLAGEKLVLVFNIFSLRKGAEQLGWELNELFEKTISAEQHFHPGTLRRFIFAVSNSHVIHPNIF